VTEYPAEAARSVNQSEEHRQRENSIILHIAKQFREPRRIDEIATIALDNHQDAFRHSMQVKQAVWRLVSDGKLTLMKDLTFGVTEFLLNERDPQTGVDQVTEQSEPDANGWYRPEVVPPKTGFYEAWICRRGHDSDMRTEYFDNEAGGWVDVARGCKVGAWRLIPQKSKPEWIK